MLNFSITNQITSRSSTNHFPRASITHHPLMYCWPVSSGFSFIPGSSPLPSLSVQCTRKIFCLCRGTRSLLSHWWWLQPPQADWGLKFQFPTHAHVLEEHIWFFAALLYAWGKEHCLALGWTGLLQHHAKEFRLLLHPWWLCLCPKHPA